MRVSISEAKIKLNNLINSGKATVITKNGDPKATIIPYDMYIKMVRLQREIDDNKAIKKAEQFFSGKKEGFDQEILDRLIEKLN